MFTRKETPKSEVKSSKASKTTPTPQTPTTSSATQRYTSFSSNPSGKKTHITIKYDVGFPNQLTIRGKGANLNWDKGQPLKNVRNDEWIWETETPFSHCEFKVLINDRQFETGENHHLTQGASVIYTPHF